MIPVRNMAMIDNPLKPARVSTGQSQQNAKDEIARLLSGYLPLKSEVPPKMGLLFGRGSKVDITTPAQLGSLIKAARKSQGLTQQQFADLSGVGRRFIVECEAGKPRLEFAKVLQVAASAGIDIFAVKR
jgi:y4mF family transcriptional regulator